MSYSGNIRVTIGRNWKKYAARKLAMMLVKNRPATTFMAVRGRRPSASVNRQETTYSCMSTARNLRVGMMFVSNLCCRCSIAEQTPPSSDSEGKVSDCKVNLLIYVTVQGKRLRRGGPWPVPMSYVFKSFLEVWLTMSHLFPYSTLPDKLTVLLVLKVFLSVFFARE